MSEWIDLFVAWPEPGRIVLVCDKYNSFVTLGRMIIDENDEGTVVTMYLDDLEIDSLITHWMPLPGVPND